MKSTFVLIKRDSLNKSYGFKVFKKVYLYILASLGAIVIYDILMKRKFCICRHLANKIWTILVVWRGRDKTRGGKETFRCKRNHEEKKREGYLHSKYFNTKFFLLSKNINITI